MSRRSRPDRFTSNERARRRSANKRRSAVVPFARRLLIERLEVRRALSITVNTLSDVSDPNDGLTTLREAIAVAAPAETINFSVTGTINLSGNQLVIIKSLSIEGPGAE